MISPISFQIEYSVEDIARIVRYRRNKNLLSRFSFIIIPTAVALIIFMVLNSMTLRTDQVNYQSVALISLVPAVILALAIVFSKLLIDPWLVNRKITKLRAESPGSGEVVNFYFSSEQIEISDSLTTSTTKWKAVTNVVETKTDFLFYGGPVFKFFIPMRAHCQRTIWSGLNSYFMIVFLKF